MSNNMVVGSWGPSRRFHQTLKFLQTLKPHNCWTDLFHLKFYGTALTHTVYPKKYAHDFCFVVVIHWLIFPYPSGLLRWHCGNLTIAPVPAKQPWWIWINTSCEFIMNDCITTTKQSTTKPCAYFLGYTVDVLQHGNWPLWSLNGFPAQRAGNGENVSM